MTINNHNGVKAVYETAKISGINVNVPDSWIINAIRYEKEWQDVADYNFKSQVSGM